VLALSFKTFFIRAMNLPELSTDRIVLRPVLTRDANDLFGLRSDPVQMKYIPRPIMQTLAEAEKMIAEIQQGETNNTLLNWTMILKDTGAFLGIMGYYRLYPEHFRAEIGYMLHSAYQGKGLMQEALKSIITFGFTELNLHTIIAVIDPDNIASENVLIKLGFTKEAHFKENVFFEGRFLDSVHYTLFNPNR
jgi:[ribosomal protein S5]-alanine N-acetyltransferase